MTIGMFTNRFNIAHRNFMMHQQTMTKSLQRISSGKRINSAADDAAGLAISEKMRSQLNGLNVQIRNTKDEINMLNTKEGAMNETHAILQRMKTLAAQASNGTLSEEDRKLINIEYKSLMDEIDRIYTSTNFNTKPVMDPEDLDAFTPDKNTLDEGKRLRDTDILTQDNAKEAMDFLDKVIVSVAASRAGIGAQVNVLEHRISYLGTMSLCLEDSLSTIEDADIAKEMMEFTKASILSQVAQAMMAHTMNDAHMIVTMLSAM